MNLLRAFLFNSDATLELKKITAKSLIDMILCELIYDDSIKH